MDNKACLPDPMDPGAPRSDREILGTFEHARDLANYGAEGRAQFVPEYPEAAATLPIDWAKVTAFLTACRSTNPPVGYKLGAKIPSDSAIPGKDFTDVDCSGFVRAAIRRSTDPKSTEFPDGSVQQHDWVQAKRFSASSVADGSLKDGKIRIAFLLPEDSPKKIGHVVLIRNAATAESHGGTGPDSRVFDGTDWQAKAKLYLLKE